MIQLISYCSSVFHDRSSFKRLIFSDMTNEITKTLVPGSFGRLLYSADTQYHQEQPFVPNMERFKFLLVDDNIINLMILSRVLKKIYPNAIIDTTQNSGVVIDMVKQISYDTIFLDIEMPVMSGTEIASIIRSEDGLSHIPLVAVTSKCHINDIQLYEKIGIDITFAKPLNVNYNNLLVDINDAIKTRRQI